MSRHAERDHAWQSYFEDASKLVEFDWEPYFRRLAERPPYGIWWEASEVDDTDDLEAVHVVLSAAVLASAAAVQGHREGGFTITMFSDDEAARLGLPYEPRTDAEVPVPPVDLLTTHDVYVASDNGFQRKARLLQALWREEHGWPCGPRGGSGTLLGSRLRMPDARDQGWNFLTPYIARLVAAEALAPKRERDKLYGQPRLFNDLLSSQPMCFNLFGELQHDLVLATAVVADLFDDVQNVTRIEFEWSPGRRDETYLGNRSAFDVFVEYDAKGGGHSFIGIETKYHESLRVKAATHKAIYDLRAEASGCFHPDTLDELRRAPMQQLWLDHLLVWSMLLRPGNAWKSGRFCVVCPAGNDRCAAACAQYKKLMSDSSTFSCATLERIVSVLRAHTNAGWVEKFALRYLNMQRLAQHTENAK